MPARVIVNRPHKMVSVVADGFFTIADIEHTGRELHAAIRSLGADAGQHVTLYDLSAAQVTAAPALERFGTFFTDTAYRGIWARRVAFVSTSALLRRQLERVAAIRDNLRSFDDRDAAIGWLLDDQDRPRTTSQPTLASG